MLKAQGRQEIFAFPTPAIAIVYRVIAKEDSYQTLNWVTDTTTISDYDNSSTS